MIPPPLICSLAEQSALLLSKGRIYQPSGKGSNAYLIHKGRRVPLEPAATIGELERAYRVTYEPVLRRLKQEHIERLQGIEAQGLKDLEQKLRDDVFKLWYVTEVQNVYIDSLDRSNELSHLEKRAKEEKMAYINVLQQIEKRDASKPSCSLEFPKHAMFVDNIMYRLARKFFSSKKTAAVIGGRSFVVAQEIDHLDRIKERAKWHLEQMLLAEWEKDNAHLAKAIENMVKFRSVVASGVAGKNGLEYHNFGFGYCDSPTVYLRREPCSEEGVAVYLKRDGDCIVYDKEAFQVQVKNDKIIRTAGICLAGGDFRKLRRNLKRYPAGAALIRFLHNVRDRVWPLGTSTTTTGGNAYDAVENNETHAGEG